MIDCQTNRNGSRVLDPDTSPSATIGNSPGESFPELWRSEVCHSPEDALTLNLSANAAAEQLTCWLALFIAPDQVVEVRALNVRRSQRFIKTESGFYHGSRLIKLAEDALRITPNAKGVYFTLNPLNPDLLARRGHRLEYAESGDCASDKDVIARHWLFIDIDPERPAKISATNEEKARAFDALGRVRDDLTSRGFPAPLVCDSGNGYHLLYRVDEPVDDSGQHQRILEYLKRRYDTDHVKIDTAVHNPARLCKVPGTWARKGDPTPERPHRVASVLEVPLP